MHTTKKFKDLTQKKRQLSHFLNFYVFLTVELPLIMENVDAMVTVSDDEIASAILLLLEREKQVVEPAGACSLAASPPPAPARSFCCWRIRRWD